MEVLLDLKSKKCGIIDAFINAELEEDDSLFIHILMGFRIKEIFLNSRKLSTL